MVVELLFGVTESREAGQAAAGEITSAAMGCFDWASEAGKVRGCAYQDSSSPSICQQCSGCGEGFGVRCGYVGVEIGPEVV
jgi:hypothetical protein